MILEFLNVSKSFRGEPVFADVTLRLESGRVYGLVGPNGSGKSVLMRLACGLMSPDSGIVRFDERFLRGGRSFPDRFGVMIDGPGFLPHVSAYENLRRLAVIQKRIGKDEILATMKALNFSPGRRRAGKLSLGNKQKLGLVQALMERPEVLILDEPFNGLDKDSSERLHSVLADCVAAGATLLLTSHEQSDIDRLADVVWRIEDGRVGAGEKRSASSPD